MSDILSPYANLGDEQSQSWLGRFRMATKAWPGMPRWPEITANLVEVIDYFSCTIRGFVGSPTWMMRYLTGLSELALREIACSAPGGS